MEHLTSKISKETWVVFDHISRRAGRAIVEYDMIREGDKILVAVSGGKDSMTLLNVMMHRRTIAPVDFELIFAHVDLGGPGPDHARLEAYFKQTGVPYYFERSKLFYTQDGSPHPDINCFWCSWNRRKVLFKLAERLQCNKVALGHHLDDVVETIVLNQFFKGEVSAMCPRQDMFGGKLSIIRPLALESEEKIIEFARGAGLMDFTSCACPRAGDTQRAAVKEMLKKFEAVNQGVKMNIFNSLSNIMTDYLPSKEAGLNQGGQTAGEE